MDGTTIRLNLKKKFQDAVKREMHENNEKVKELSKKLVAENVDGFDKEAIDSKKTKLSFEDVQTIQNSKDELKNKFKQERVDEINKIDLQKKLYKPITDALIKVESAVKKVDEDMNKVVEKKQNLALEPSMIVKALVDSDTQTPKTINIGPIAKKYVARLLDPVFGVYYDPVTKTHKIGKEEVDIRDDDIIIMNKRYKGTPGFWRLITYNEAPNPELYTKEDLNNYVDVLNKTDAMYQNNDKTKNKPKSSKGDKWLSLVSNIWNSRNIRTGSGLIHYSDNQVEYKYVRNLNELMNRLCYMRSQEEAGNNNFHNEKLGIVRFFTSELENIIDSPKGTEYLIRFVSILPKSVLNEGSGIFNKILNSLPFELHVPSYNFLGPGTRLDERLERGDKPINKLDAAALDHDIFYKHHKSTNDRHKADEVLENKAWERVLAPDANLKEKSVAWLTTNGMKLKRKFGLGLKF